MEKLNELNIYIEKKLDSEMIENLFSDDFIEKYIPENEIKEQLKKYVREHSVNINKLSAIEKRDIENIIANSSASATFNQLKEYAKKYYIAKILKEN